MPNTPFDVVGVGANAIDEIYRLPDYPNADGPHAKLRIRQRSRSPGGQTATTLATCTTAGLSAAYVGTIGNDTNGQLARLALEEHGIDITAVVTREAPNAYAVILLDESVGERIVLWDRDPALQLKPEEIPDALLQSTRLVHVDDVDENAAIQAAARAVAAGVTVTSDIERVGDRTAELIKLVTIPIFAEHVPQALTGERDLEGALRALRRTHNGLLCVTRGARGAVMLEGDQLHEETTPKMEVTDTTGAGDVFRGAFIAALLKGQTPPRILAVATAAASLSCARHGAIPGIPTADELNALLHSD
jgi:sugar/nucleoside kinase (ribokinase family)